MKKFSTKLKKAAAFMLAVSFVLPAAACGKNKSGEESTQEEENAEDGEIIYDGVSIGGIDVGGLTEKAAKEKLETELVVPEKIAVDFKDQTREIISETIDVKPDIDTAVKAAAEIGRTGTEDERVAEVEALAEEPADIAVSYICDREKLVSMLNAIKQETDKLTGAEKFSMDVEKTADTIENSIKAGVFEGIVPVSADVDEDYEETLIGSYSTSFTASDANRNENLRVACEKINGTVLQPGDIFDMNSLLGPQTAANGYKNAGVIENGKIVSAIAGGVCQVTTTVYNAAIFAELKIVERYNHSLMVGYVPLGRDAAVAGTYKNLRFQNDTDYPVRIEAYIDNYKVVCNIYGKEIHDAGHKVDFEKVWVATVNKPAEKITEDPNMYTDERVVTYTGKTGAKVDTYKLVYEDGKLVSREWFSSSTYSATADEVTVGTKEREPENTEETPVIGGGETTQPSTPSNPEPSTPSTPAEVPTQPSTPTEPTTPPETTEPIGGDDDLPTIGAE